MSEFDIENHLAEHGGAFTGEDGRDFLKKSMAAAKLTRELIENTLKRTRDVQQTVDEITDQLTKDTSDLFLSRDVLFMVVGQMTRFLSKQLT
jgi:hypothetical protein